MAKCSNSCYLPYARFAGLAYFIHDPCNYARLLNRIDKHKAVHEMHSDWCFATHDSSPNTGARSIVVIELARTILADIWQAIAGVHLLFLRFTGGIKIRALSSACDTHCVSTMGGKAIGCRVVLFKREPLCVNGSEGITYADTVVPEGNVILLPLEPNVDLLSRSNKLVEIFNDGVSFCFRNANNIRDEPWSILAY